MNSRFRRRTTPLAALLVCAVAVRCGGRHVNTPRIPATGISWRVDGVMSILPNTKFDTLDGVAFGGVSGLAYDAVSGELLGVCDDSRNSRVFRMKLVEDPLSVEPIGVIKLETGGNAPPKLDAEGLVILPNGHLLISSEGIGNQEPRLPPAIVEYTREGRFVRQLPVPPKFVPTPSGQLTSGVRDNAAFESLTLTPDRRYLFTGTESALVQDGEMASFERGATSRLIEYERQGDSYVPVRELAYEVDSIHGGPFNGGIAINGLVELLAMSDRDLLALERSYVESAERRGKGTNRIRLYRVSLDKATDVSGLASLRGQPITPAAKTLLFDLGSVPGLPQALSALDNFEGLALLGSRNGASSLLMVSDDNFSDTQRTWFVKLEWR